MGRSTRVGILGFLVVALLMSVMAQGCAEGSGKAKYPSKNIKMLVHSTPGSALDTMARAAAPILSRDLGQTVVVENKPGGSGTELLAELQTDAADGYTLGGVTAVVNFLFANGTTPYKLDQFSHVARLIGEPSSIIVKADSPYKTVQELISAAKANPGKINAGGPGAGTFNNMIALLLGQKAGAEVKWIPYPGGADAMVALLGGHIDVVITPPSSGRSQVQNNQAKVLALTSREKSKFWPGVPTLAEVGVDIDVSNWRGVIAKKGLPPEVMNTLNEAFAKMVKDKDWEAYLDKYAQDGFFQPTADFEKAHKAEYAETEKMVALMGK